jgi:hypothetical protein
MNKISSLSGTYTLSMFNEIARITHGTISWVNELRKGKHIQIVKDEIIVTSDTKKKIITLARKDNIDDGYLDIESPEKDTIVKFKFIGESYLAHNKVSCGASLDCLDGLSGYSYYYLLDKPVFGSYDYLLLVKSNDNKYTLYLAALDEFNIKNGINFIQPTQYYKLSKSIIK